METQRNGEWIDELGCCRVCDGEIPYGHDDSCDFYKLQKELDTAKRETQSIRDVNKLIEESNTHIAEQRREMREALSDLVERYDGLPSNDDADIEAIQNCKQLLK